MTTVLKGIIASHGISMGPVKKFVKEELNIHEEAITKEQVEKEQGRLEDVFQSYTDELTHESSDNETQQEILKAHLALVQDPFFIGTAREKIASSQVTAEWALYSTVEMMVEQIKSLDDEYLQERAIDYKDIGENLLYRLKGIKAANLSYLSKDYIIVCEELTPSDTSNMDKDHVLGFANDKGGKTSHTSIIAQTLGIPALVGMGDVSRQLEDEDFVILDGEKGLVIANPDQATIDEYKALMEEKKKDAERLEQVKNQPAITADGRQVEVAANMGNLKDLDDALASGADGIGLFRTEFLYMDNDHFPTEEEQFAVYKQAALELDGKPLIIRTLDIGGDKALSYFDFPEEDNPFLGWRAIRICLSKPEIFNTQLRAILRASAFGNVKILLPMIISVEEVRQVKAIVKDLMKELDQEGEKYNPNIPIGVMAETPASAILADELAAEVDFFSIGTNDLTQYVLAVDRGNQKIADLYESYHPAVLRSIDRIIKAAHRHHIKCGMCGAFAGDTDATYMLLGMGLDEFSAPVPSVAKVKDIVIRANYEEAQAFADKVTAASSMEEVHQLIMENPYH